MSYRGVVAYCSSEHTVFLFREGTEWGGHTRLTSPLLIHSCSLACSSQAPTPLHASQTPTPTTICLSSLPAAPPGSDLLLYLPPPSLTEVSAIASPVPPCMYHTLLCLSLVSITHSFLAVALETAECRATDLPPQQLYL